MERPKTSFGSDVRAAETSPAPVRRSLSFGALWPRRARPAAFLKEEELKSLFTVGGARGEDVSIGFLLRQSAAAIERGRALIDARGADIAAVVASRGVADAALAAWAARLMIALFWVFVGVVLAREAGIGAARGLDQANAAALARIFVAAGIIGAAAAFVGGSLVRAAERSTAASGAFGREAGLIARNFAESVDDIRAQLAEGESGAVSRLHCVALEAASFFDGIAFLSEPDHGRAEARFAEFLSRQGPAGAGGGALLLAAFVVALLFYTVASMAGLPVFDFGGLPLWTIIALPGLALLYVVVGPVFLAAGAGAAGANAARARHEALVALRTAYVEAGAPRVDDLLQTIEQALSSGRPSSSPSHHHAAESENEPAWRRGAEPPRFVAKSFDAAPPVFRTERQANFSGKFFGSRGGNAAPKQSASAPDAPPWLKD